MIYKHISDIRDFKGAIYSAREIFVEIKYGNIMGHRVKIQKKEAKRILDEIEKVVKNRQEPLETFDLCQLGLYDEKYKELIITG